MIEKVATRLMQQSNREGPLVLVNCRAHLACGCSAWVGELATSRKEVTLIRACSPGHDEVADLTQAALTKRLQRPLDRPLVEIVDGLLREAHAVVG